MKHFISYTILIISGYLIFSSHLLQNINKIGQNIITSEDTIKIKKDTFSNKLPEGYPYITNFSFSKQKKIKSVCTDSIGIMIFTDNTGLTFFDGETEKHLKIESSPNVIKKDKILNRFYIACNKGYGYLLKDNTGNYVYHSISEKLYDKQSYNHIIVTSDNVVFSGKYKIVNYDLKTKKLSDIYNDNTKAVTGIFKLNDKLYINLTDEGLQTVSDKKKSSIISDSLFANSEILFSVPYEKNIILGMSNNQLYIFDGTNYSPYDNKASDYIKESIINTGAEINNKQFVVTSFNGGAIILDKKTGNTESILNYRTGLPDDEIFAAGTDHSGGLWLAHEYGISRIAFDIPIKNFDRFPGLQGNINAVKFYDSTLYVATGEGLFRLSEIKNYEEVEIAENKQVKYRKKVQSDQKNAYSDNSVDKKTSSTDEEEKGETDNNDNFFKRWKKRKNKKNKETSEDLQNNKPKNNPRKTTYKTEYKTITEYKKIYELHSVKYVYKKVDGINSKCKNFTDFKSGILISSNSGLFFLKNNNTIDIIPNAYIYNVSCTQKSDIFYVSTSEGLYKIIFLNGIFEKELIYGNSIKETVLKSIFTVSDSVLWASGNHKIFLLKILGNDILSTEQFDIKTDFDEKIIISKKADKFIFLTGSKAFYYDKKYNKLSEDNELTDILSESDNIYLLNDTVFSINSGSNVLYGNNLSDSLYQIKYAWIFNQIKKLTIDDKNNIWLISGENEIFKIEQTSNQIKKKFKLFLTNIKDFNGNSLTKTSYLKLKSNYNRITVFLSAPGYLKKEFVSYFYGIDVSSNNEFITTRNPYFPITKLSPGKHVLSIYAVNSLNEKSETLKVIIQVTPPIWQTTWFIIAVFLIFLIIVSLGLSAFFRKKQQKIKEYNEILELKVKERTSEIEKQNQLIQNQNLEIYEQYKKIDYQNKEITGSIRYAGKIQRAALSDTGIYSKYVSEFFILYKPRDIVSGDFYWISESKNKLLIAAVDCTGHGVPGGFLSMLGISFLNEIVKEIGKTHEKILAADILNELRKKIITTLSTHGEEERKDGMDMSLAIIDKENMQLNFAGANNPSYILRDAKIAKIEADRMPVGSNKKLNDIPFKNKYLTLKTNDCIYLFSDGFADQFGGKFLKKFNSRRFREMLLHIHSHPMAKQEEMVDKILDKWKGNSEQIDDILLIGIKI
ncbi:MAG: hypothetical protein DRI94_07740 [Bacteroidetes bacterium]|nr:MAG: hypothetical protein DRI94_07740 [Bacteroidota bacterium]